MIQLYVMRRNEILLALSGVLGATSPYCYNDTVLTNLSTGYAVSVFFYFLVVRFPEKRKNKRLIAAFERKYHMLKRNCLTVIWSCSEGSVSFERIEELMEPGSFTEYARSDEWYDFLNGLDASGVNELKHHFRIFREDLHFFLSAIEISDEKLFEKFENISIWTAQIDLFGSEYDDVKTWGKTLFSLLADWSPIDGDHKYGIIGDLISDLKAKA